MAYCKELIRTGLLPKHFQTVKNLLRLRIQLSLYYSVEVSILLLAWHFGKTSEDENYYCKYLFLGDFLKGQTQHLYKVAVYYYGEDVTFEGVIEYIKSHLDVSVPPLRENCKRLKFINITEGKIDEHFQNFMNNTVATCGEDMTLLLRLTAVTAKDPVLTSL
uniref:HORMA domain-containing protein n=1 Tax=Strongyloides papillosus TaxID=174720 RepID=A0A0N5BQ70_STREA